MKPEWQLHMEHDRAVVDTQCEVTGQEKPLHPERCVKNPAELWRDFNGTKFFPLLQQKGHSCSNFDDCQCRRR